MRRFVSKYKVIVFLLVLPAFYFCAKPSFAMSNEVEAAIGRQVDMAIEKEYRFLKNPGISKYLEHISLKLVSVSERADIVYHFRVLDTEEIDAMAAVGGYVYITRGMLVNLQNEAELAAVLAHQIVHIARRHGIKRIEKDAELAGIELSRRRSMILRGADFAFVLIEAGYGKKLETEADIKGAQYLLKAGYSPEAMIDMLNVIQVKEKQYPELLSNFLRVHRKTTRRIDKVKLMLSNLRAAYGDGYDSVLGNFYSDRYKVNVLDVLAAQGQKSG